MNKVRIIVLALIVSLSLFSSSFAVDTPTKITLEVRAPFSYAIVFIDASGEMKYEFIPNPRAINSSYTTDKKNISPAGFEELINFIAEKKFYDLNGLEYEEGLTDGSTYIITVTFGDSIKSARYYGVRSCKLRDSMFYHVNNLSKVPHELYEIKDKIEALLGREIQEVGV